MTVRDRAPLGAPCWIDLFTNDPEGARAFYGELFGWTSEVGGEEYGGYITFAKDGVTVAGCMGNADADHPADFWTIYLATDDAQATVAAAEAAGGQTFLPPMVVGDLGQMAMIADAGGAAVGLWQPGEHAGFGVWNESGTPAWFELHTRDHAASVAFYESVLGWQTVPVGATDEFRYTWLDNPDGEGGLAGVMDASAFLPEGVPAHWSVYFGVDDADATIAQALELGASVVMPAEDTPYGRLATLADPTGAIFKLVRGPE